MKNNELEKLFSDQVLEPTKQFEKKLHARLMKPQKSSFGSLVFKRVGVLSAATILVFGIVMFRPNSTQPSRFVLMRSLLEKASADELKSVPNVNFWQISGVRKTGPKALLCTNQEIGLVDTNITLLYKNAQESAYFTNAKGSYAYTDMRYSSDPETPAFEDAIFKGAGSSDLLQYLVGATLTDAEGRELQSDATIEEKTVGEYELFAKIHTEPEDVKNYVEGCEDLRIKLRIDAVSGLYTYVGVYATTEATLEDAALSFDSTRIVEYASYTDFASIEERFTSAGFSRAEAEKFMETASTRVKNTAAGYVFSYSKRLLGDATLEEVRNDVGEVTAYAYTFSKHPEVVFRIYTSTAQDVPDLATKVGSEGYEILDEPVLDMINLPGYGTVESSFVSIRDSIKKYSLHRTGSTDIPAAYIEGPINLGVYERYDAYAPAFPAKVDDVLSLVGITVFKPGTELPTGL